MTRTDADIKAAVKEWCLNPALALAQYGHISCWNVSRVTNMACLFNSQENFNDDISRWEVANVKDMGSMFGDASSFNQDLSDWAVSADTKTGCMFINTDSLLQKPRWFKQFSLSAVQQEDQ